MSNEKTTSGGISLCSAVFLVFLVLKLTDNIDWSWWWVTAPLWGGIAIAIAVIVVILFCTILVVILFPKKYIAKKHMERRQHQLLMKKITNNLKNLK